MIRKPPVCTDLLGLYEPYVHRNCLHNELNSLCNRVMAPTVEPDRHFVNRLKELARAIGRLGQCRCERLTWAGFVASYKGTKRRKYDRALKELLQSGLQPRHWSTTHFVKPDKNTKSKDARAIQGRHPCYNICLGSYLKPFEEWFINMRDFHDLLPQYNFPRGRFVAKGLNAVQRGELLHEKWQQMKNPAGKACDATRYDQHISKPALEVEHEAYLAAYMYNATLLELLQKQLVNKGKTSKGWKYWVEGRRMSGDINTGLGNSLLMSMFYIQFFTDMRDRSFEFEGQTFVIGYDGSIYEWDNNWQLLDDGDDAVIIIEKRAEKAFDLFIGPFFQRLGFKMTVEDTVYDFEHLDFCQSRPVRVGNKYVMVRNPIKALSGSLCSVYSVRDIKSMKQLVWATGQCELALGAGVPIMQEFALACIRNGLQLKERRLDQLRHEMSYRYWVLPEKVQPTTISPETRYSFARAFGIPVSQQLIAEEELRGWSISLDGIQHLQEPRDSGEELIFEYPH